MFDEETVMDHIPDSGQGSDGVLQPIDQLELVMADVESFLTDWLGRVEQLHALSATPDGLIRNRMREFELEKSQWDAKRKRETNDIHEKAEELAKAWLRLEQEQRRFLQVRENQTQNTRVPAPDNGAREKSVESETSADQNASLPSASMVADERGLRRPSPLQGHRAGVSAARQFEQLRREVLTSRHQHRRV